MILNEYETLICHRFHSLSRSYVYDISFKLVCSTAMNCGRCSTFCSSGTSIFRAFLIMGWGFSSSSEKRCRRGSNASWPGTLDSARSAGSGSKFTMMSLLLPLATAGGPGGPGGQVEGGDGSWGTDCPPEGRRAEEREWLVMMEDHWRSLKMHWNKPQSQSAWLISPVCGSHYGSVSTHPSVHMWETQSGFNCSFSRPITII